MEGALGDAFWLEHGSSNPKVETPTIIPEDDEAVSERASCLVIELADILQRVANARRLEECMANGRLAF